MGRTKCGGWVALALLTIASCGGGPDTRVNGDMAFVGVNVLPMDSERVLENQTVVVDDGRIVAIGSSDEVGPADGVDVIEAAGHYLMPGLTEMHGHLPNPQTSDTDAQNLLFLYVANGVTTVRGMQGHPSQFAVRDQIDRGSIIGPRLFLGSVSINGARVSSPEQAEQLVREYKVQGYDLHQDARGLERGNVRRGGADSGGGADPVWRARAQPGWAATRPRIRAGLDRPPRQLLSEALVPETAQPDEWPGTGGLGALLASVDESLIPEIVDATVQADAWVVPTMVLWETGIFSDRPSDVVLAERPEGRYMPPETVERWTQTVDERFAASDVETNRRLAARPPSDDSPVVV